MARARARHLMVACAPAERPLARTRAWPRTLNSPALWVAMMRRISTVVIRERGEDGPSYRGHPERRFSRWLLRNCGGLSRRLRRYRAWARTSWSAIATRCCCCRRVCASGCLRGIWRGCHRFGRGAGPDGFLWRLSLRRAGLAERQMRRQLVAALEAMHFVLLAASGVGLGEVGHPGFDGDWVVRFLLFKKSRN